MQIKHANRRRNNNNIKNNDDASTHDNDDKNKNWRRKKGHYHLWSNCPDNPDSKIIRATIATSVGTHGAKTDIGTVTDGARGTKIIHNNDGNRNCNRNRDRHSYQHTRCRDRESSRTDRQEVSSTGTRSIDM